MKATIDFKSALYGLAAGILTMLALGSTQPSHPIGRYQVSGSAGFYMILDTSTGKGWCVNVAGQNFTGTHTGFWESKVDK